MSMMKGEYRPQDHPPVLAAQEFWQGQLQQQAAVQQQQQQQQVSLQQQAHSSAAGPVEQAVGLGTRGAVEQQPQKASTHRLV